MKRSLLRALIASLLIMPVATLGFWWLLRGAPKGASDEFPVLTWVFAAVLGSVVSAIGALITFAFSQYPRSARTGAFFASGFCILLTGLGVFSDLHNGEKVTAGPLLLIWLLLWPVGFLVSLWVDLKHFVAKRIVDSATKK
jgi:hypothetical protein